MGSSSTKHVNKQKQNIVILFPLFFVLETKQHNKQVQYYSEYGSSSFFSLSLVTAFLPPQINPDTHPTVSTRAPDGMSLYLFVLISLATTHVLWYYIIHSHIWISATPTKKNDPRSTAPPTRYLWAQKSTKGKKLQRAIPTYGQQHTTTTTDWPINFSRFVDQIKMKPTHNSNEPPLQ